VVAKGFYDVLVYVWVVSRLLFFSPGQKGTHFNNNPHFNFKLPSVEPYFVNNAWVIVIGIAK